MKTSEKLNYYPCGRDINMGHCNFRTVFKDHL